MLANIVETFHKFNQGQRRPDRRRHLELCGFERTRVIEPFNHEATPRELAMRHLNALSESDGGFYHGVTLPKKDYEGWAYYEVWTKKL